MLHKKGEEMGKLRPRAAFAKTQPIPLPCPYPLGHLHIPGRACQEAQGTWGQVAARDSVGAAAAYAPPG